MTEFTKNNTRDGFSLIVVLIVITVLALIVGGGWYAREEVFPFTEKVYSNILQNVGILKPVQSVCTQEAKLCPDGKTYVGRTGPNCEFQECPTYRPQTCGFGESPECTADSRVMMCSPDGKGRKYVASNCSCGEDARSLEALGWKSCEDSGVDTSNWKTYRNEKYGFEIKYPPIWSVNDSETMIRFEENQTIYISFSAADTRAMGVAYCQAYLGDKRAEGRCEYLKNGVTIDWGVGNPAAFVGKNNLSFFFTLHASGAERRDVFREFLDSFQFSN